MKNRLLLFLLFFLGLCIISFAQKEKKLKKILELKIPGGKDLYGACVAWHPVTKKYYAALTGDKKSFIGIYDAKGKLLSPPTLETMCDVRGIWYNDSSKTLQLNGYKDFGWAEYVLDTNGYPSVINKLHTGMLQPNEQSVGTFNVAKQQLYFLLENTVLTYDFKTATLLEQPVELKPEEEHKKKQEEKKAGQEGEEEEEEEGGEFNTTSLIYTGIKGEEFGMMNYAEKRILLFNAANGKKVVELELPKNAPVSTLLNFAYCNGIYWLYHRKSGVWMGYK